MSKAGEKSRHYREFREECGIKDLVMLDEIEEAYFEGYNQAEVDLTDKAKTSSGWDGFFYGQGYRQAEKDNELTWEDIKTIDTLLAMVNVEGDYVGKDAYQEVLKRFNKERKETKY